MDGRDNELRALRSEEHTSELQSPCNLVCRLLLEKKTIISIGLEGTKLYVPSGESSKFVRSAVGKGCDARVCPEEKSKTSIVFATFFFKDAATNDLYTFSLTPALQI